MIKRRHLLLSFAVSCFGLVFYVVSRLNGWDEMGFLSIVMMIAGMIYKIYICRCPHCSMLLRRVNFLSWDPGYCPRCGEKIDFEE